MASGSARVNSSDGFSVQVPIPTLVTGFVQCFLQGIIFVQASHYWETAWSDDSICLRIYVVFVVLLSILQTILADYKVWRIAIFLTQWETSSLLWTELFLNGFIVTVCSAFLIRRCWKVTKKNIWVLCSLGVFSVSLLIANILMAVAVQKISRMLAAGQSVLLLKLIRSSSIIYIYWTYGTLALDITLTAIIIIFLWRSRTGLRSSDKVLLRVSTITWESALLPAISMLVAIGLYHNDPTADNQLVVLFFVLTGKLYTLGLLRTLNTRVKLRERMKSHDLGRTSLGNWQWEQGTTTRLDSMLPSTLGDSGRQRSVIPPINVHSQVQQNCESTGFSPISREGSDEMPLSSPHLDARESGFGIRRAGSNICGEEGETHG